VTIRFEKHKGGSGASLWKILGRVVIAALCAFAVWRYIDLRELAKTLQQTTLPWLAVLLTLATVDRFLMAYKWRELLVAGGTDVPFGTTLSAYYQGSIAKWLLPTSVGMDAVRGVVVSAHARSAATVLGSMLAEKAVGSIAAIGLGCIGMAIAGLATGNGAPRSLALSIGLVAGLTVLGLHLSLRAELMARLIRRFPQRLRDVTERSYQAYSAFRSRPQVLYRNLALCFLEQALQIGIILLGAVALGIVTHFLILVAGVCIAQAIKKFALLFEGWILGEVTTVVVCSALGANPAHALAFSLLWKMTSTLASAPGVPLFIRSGGCVTELRQMVSTSRASK
jgi:uncharacterized membrane protein YbhN (UPF0104 family)